MTKVPLVKIFEPTPLARGGHRRTLLTPVQCPLESVESPMVSVLITFGYSGSSKPLVDPPPPEEDPGVYIVVVHDRSIATINALGRVCDAYLSPIIDRLRTLAGTENVQMARLVYTRPSLAESPELVSYKSGFSPVAQAIASMKAGAAGEPTDALSLVDAIMLALQVSVHDRSGP
jgi:hypothetical protein